MDNQTNKNDWLNSLLAMSEDILVSGHSSFANRVGLSDEDIVTVRFIGNARIGYTYVLVITSEKINWSRVKQVFGSLGIENKALKSLLQTFNNKMPIILSDKNSMSFSILDNTKNFKDFSSDDLQKYFGSINIDLIKDIGTVKDINKTINDGFQKWTRANLSRYVTVNDFDAISLTVPTIFELKRVQQDIIKWMPFVDDASNYRALMSIRDELKVRLRIVAYQEVDQSKVALHTIENVSSNFIEGRALICRPEDVVNTPIGTPYTSTNRRQRPRQ